MNSKGGTHDEDEYRRRLWRVDERDDRIDGRWVEKKDGWRKPTEIDERRTVVNREMEKGEGKNE